ncbi:MAG TPA: putative toxin-antitoxin system toxin component, PIN family [Cytophagales bacterium]|jgi:uncharacterized protein|nr:putative toxin-antitoxin system toxin component, PIN family [Cytophagales bacterium]
MRKSKLTEEVQKLIVDTNILVSSLLGKSYPYKIIYDLVFTDRVKLFISPSILEEYQGVLSRRKFQKKTSFYEDAKNLVDSILEVGILINPKTSIDILPDKSDNKFLDLSIAVQADCLITGNTKHFPFRQFESTLILSPKEYWDTFWK